MNDLISVIIPVYNTQHYLEKAIQSVLSQTYRSLEIILADDGSTDTSGKICDEFAASDARIRVIHKENGGISSARNAALALASGSYIFFLDSDDYLEPDALEYLYSNLITSDADISVGAICDVSEDGSELYRDILHLSAPVVVMNEKSFWAYSINKKIGVMATGKLYKRFFWDTLRFPDGKIHEDDGTIVKVMAQCHLIVCSDKICMNYRMRTGSIMQTAFSVKNLDKIAFLAERVTYFLSKEYYEYCYPAYFVGMELISKAVLCKDAALKKAGKEQYRTYRTLAKELLPHIKPLSQKISLTLFAANLSLYTLIRYRLRHTK